ncbi:MAG: DUF2520 domain-containing protein, partial [Bryobacterales bacterium]|nr:DUF2520 domain-containing protein [Bryobacterales bacterium]
MDTTSLNTDRLPASIGIVGTGNVAQALGASLGRQGIPVRALAGRDREKTLRAARFAGAATAVTIEEIGSQVEAVLVAVSDHAIAEVASQIAGGNSLPFVAMHTCGSIGTEVLQPLRDAGCATGVLHPLQTIPSPERGAETLPHCYFAYCGDPAAMGCAQQLIAHLGGRSLRVDASSWALYHAAAVLSINYHVTLVDASLELWERAGIPRKDALEAL